jgi:hypothetical protein
MASRPCDVVGNAGVCVLERKKTLIQGISAPEKKYRVGFDQGNIHIVKRNLNRTRQHSLGLLGDAPGSVLAVRPSGIGLESNVRSAEAAVDRGQALSRRGKRTR